MERWAPEGPAGPSGGWGRGGGVLLVQAEMKAAWSLIRKSGLSHHRLLHLSPPLSTLLEPPPPLHLLLHTTSSPFTSTPPLLDHSRLAHKDQTCLDRARASSPSLKTSGVWSPSTVLQQLLHLEQVVSQKQRGGCHHTRSSPGPGSWTQVLSLSLPAGREGEREDLGWGWKKPGSEGEPGSGEQTSRAVW